MAELCQGGLSNSKIWRLLMMASKRRWFGGRADNLLLPSHSYRYWTWCADDYSFLMWELIKQGEDLIVSLYFIGSESMGASGTDEVLSWWVMGVYIGFGRLGGFRHKQIHILCSHLCPFHFVIVIVPDQPRRIVKLTSKVVEGGPTMSMVDLPVWCNAIRGVCHQ